jgi:hypothetical protein
MSTPTTTPSRGSRRGRRRHSSTFSAKKSGRNAAGRGPVASGVAPGAPLNRVQPGKAGVNVKKPFFRRFLTIQTNKLEFFSCQTFSRKPNKDRAYPSALLGDLHLIRLLALAGSICKGVSDINTLSLLCRFVRDEEKNVQQHRPLQLVKRFIRFRCCPDREFPFQ